MRPDRWLWCLLPLISGCSGEPQPLLGTLEWDRVAITADASERVLSWHVAEGDQVDAGALLLTLDTRRIDARIAQTGGELAQAVARLSELANGTRIESIDAARADVASARAAQVEAEQDYVRSAELRERGLVAAATLDRRSRRATSAAPPPSPRMPV
jgi:HlyD family secretion protein